MKRNVISIIALSLLFLLANVSLAYGTTHDVQLGPEPCPPNIPDPQPSRLQISTGDFVRFHTSASCDFWVRGQAPIGEFRLGIHGDTERVVGPFTGKLTTWDYWVVDGAVGEDSTAGIIYIPTGSLLTQLGTIILVLLMAVSAAWILTKRKRRPVPV